MQWLARFGPAPTVTVAAALSTLGWVCQIVGHVMFERRKPAFLDDLSQMLIGPMFIAAKALVALGLRRDPAELMSK